MYIRNTLLLSLVATASLTMSLPVYAERGDHGEVLVLDQSHLALRAAAVRVVLAGQAGAGQELDRLELLELGPAAGGAADPLEAADLGDVGQQVLQHGR